jgi:hypothetical protein
VGQQPEQLRRPDDVDHTTRPRVAGPHSKHHSLLRSRLGGSDQDRNTTSGQEHHIRKVNFYGVPARAAVQLIMHADSRSGTVKKIDLASDTEDDAVDEPRFGPALEAGLQDEGHLVARTAELSE